MDHNEYFRRALAIHKREKVAIDALAGLSIAQLLASKGGEPAPTITHASLIARHQAIVAEMVSLGEEFARA